jgi:hypothetical protein
LIASVPGSTTVQPAETSVVAMRTAIVTLQGPRSLPASDPADGVPLRVAARSSVGGVPSGTIEARLGQETVGIAPIRNGNAELVVTFEPRHGGSSAELELRYLPDAPWWVPGPPQRVAVPIRPPSPWRRLPWLFAAIAVALWVMAGWRRPVRTERPTEQRPPARPPQAAIRLLERRDEGSGWTGRVVDAHDGSPISEAAVVVRRRTFQGDGIVASVVSDGDGNFSLLPPDVADEAAVIEVTARWHSRFSAELPPPGVLVLELVSRRRALLQRLVDWATQQGGPWAQPGEPTPGQIASAAEGDRNSAVASWARATEEAAYGPNPPDDAAEERVRSHEPRG